MATTSHTVLSAPLAESVAQLAEQLATAGDQLRVRSFHRRIEQDEIRGCAMTSEALDAARRALERVLIVAQHYGPCSNAAAAWDAYVADEPKASA